MSAINREDAIKALEEVVGAMHPYRILGVIETYSQYNEAWQDAINKAEQAIEALPDADDGWIPVEERPPENADTKLLTHEIRFTNGVIKRDVTMAYYDDENEDWLTESENPEILCHPLAWRDLPKPYEPKEDK